MSVEYFFYNKPLSRKALLEQTDFTIETHNNSEWIINGPESYLRIKDSDADEIYVLEKYGFKDVLNIMDTIVDKFKIIFYTDNELEEYMQMIYNFHKFDDQTYYTEEGKYNFYNACKRAMYENGGYIFEDIENPIITIPQRNEQDYLNSNN